jgi:selenocysteine-specific elongation factor
VGDELVLEPGGLKCRVRGLQNHDAPTDEVHRGQRAAINLAGVRHDEIVRGEELASPGHLAASRLLSVKLNLVKTAERPLKNRTRVRCHLGTAELLASVVLLDCDRLLPGEAALAQLFLSEPAAAVWGQPLVIRSESPVETIGGGVVLDPHPPKLARDDSETLERLAELASDDPSVRALAAVYFFGLAEWRADDLSRSAGVDDAEPFIADSIRRGDIVELTVSPTRKLRVHRLALEQLYRRIERLLDKEHQKYPLRAMLDRAPLATRLDYLGSDALVEAVLAAMQRAGRLKATDRGVALPGRGPQLTQSEQRLVSWIIESYRAAGFQPPTVDELRAQTAKNQQAVPQLVALAAAEGHLVEAAPGLYLHAESERKLREMLAEPLAGEHGLTVSQIRDLLGVSRKHAVPWCEYLDRIGFTRRDGDLRRLAAPATLRPIANG